MPTGGVRPPGKQSSKDLRGSKAEHEDSQNEENPDDRPVDPPKPMYITLILIYQLFQFRRWRQRFTRNDRTRYVR